MRNTVSRLIGPTAQPPANDRPATLWDLHGLAERVTLTVSELLTNVLRHVQPDAGTGTRSARLTVRRLPGALNVCVRDFNQAFPAPSCAAAGAEDGRGLQLVRAIADDFGWSPALSGKDVWATFTIPSVASSEGTRSREAS
ncbi:ATP-binding protein [Streptomyces cylindrosporus]|uniref:ATP-binding protein n=1 Tax=Streptomyces cylindrosporus TaxID=2927583 RepID=A0ABS9Y871_9ACTN|nr:ATP-binding protein [Streptomyces cylindrosporus]MCI3273432.1 ATP-binding protein [Streptomyces cylindrosporus]